jgi:hypothetical protein
MKTILLISKSQNQIYKINSENVSTTLKFSQYFVTT